MVNNAGVGGLDKAGKIHEMTEGTWDFTLYYSLDVGLSTLTDEPSAPLIGTSTPAPSS